MSSVERMYIEREGWEDPYPRLIEQKIEVERKRLDDSSDVRGNLIKRMREMVLRGESVPQFERLIVFDRWLFNLMGEADRDIKRKSHLTPSWSFIAK